MGVPFKIAGNRESLERFVGKLLGRPNATEILVFVNDVVHGTVLGLSYISETKLQAKTT